MIKRMISSLMALALVALPLLAAGDKKETERLENCGEVIKEVMDIPDDIPQDLIDKSECLIVFPSVLWIETATGPVNPGAAFAYSDAR